MPVIFLVIGYAAMQSKEVKELMPALRSSWLFFHVSTAIIAYGGFGVSFAVSLMFLLREKMNGSDFWNQHIPDRLGKLLVLGSEGDMVAGHMAHLYVLSPSPHPEGS